MRLLVDITDYTGSTFLRDQITVVYHHDPYWLDCAVSHFLAILFYRNGAVSPPPWFIVVFVLFICLLLADE